MTCSSCARRPGETGSWPYRSVRPSSAVATAQTFWKKLGRKPPQTWNEYRDLAGLLAAEKPEGVQTWSGAIEPLSPGWAGLTLLARVAPAAKHRSNYSTLFNIETMEPLIAGPPFVEALESLVAAAKFAGDDPLRFDPAEARRAFWRGRVRHGDYLADGRRNDRRS